MLFAAVVATMCTLILAMSTQEGPMAVEITRKVNGNEYAVARESVRQGNRVVKSRSTYLGLVLDKSRGIFKSRKRGIFYYDDKTNTYGPAPDDFVPVLKGKKDEEKLILDFGDAYLFNNLIKKYGLDESINTIESANLESIYALLLFYLIKSDSLCHAYKWYEGSFTKILYPNAKIVSQRVSELLVSIGTENNMRRFFAQYIKLLGNDIQEGANILIDSTGLPNSIQFPLTAVSNHNGEISEEVRLIYVVQQKTRLPIYMRYVPGNVIDTSTLVTTIKELKAMGVNTKFAILDAGYVSEKGFNCLCEEKISFITRCPENRLMYKQAVEMAIKDLEVAENIAVDEDGNLFNGRHVYIKMVKLDHKIGSDKSVNIYAYVCKDKSTQEKQRKHAISDSTYNKKLDKQKFHSDYLNSGIFVLLSTRQIRADLVLNHYYIRQDIEQVFDIAKNYGSLTPLRIENEDTFRGHLLMTFMATYILQRLQNEIKKTKFSIKDILYTMQTQKVKVFETVAIPQEPVKNHNEIYKLLGVKHCSEYRIGSAPV